MADYQKPSFQNRDNRPSPPPLPEKLKNDILTTGIKTEHIPLLKNWGEYLASKDKNDKAAMSTSQLRKFFGEIKRLQADDFSKVKGDIILLDPKIAYAVGRAERSSRIKDFYNLVSPLLNQINEDEKYFKNFVNIIESIVAYHKTYNVE